MCTINNDIKALALQYNRKTPVVLLYSRVMSVCDFIVHLPLYRLALDSFKYYSVVKKWTLIEIKNNEKI